MSTQQTQPKLQKIGAGWKKTSKKGTDFLSGNFKIGDGPQIAWIAFTNDNKLSENQPDIQFYLSEPRPSATPAPAPAPKVKPVTKAVVAPAAPTQTGPEEEDNQLI